MYIIWKSSFLKREGTPETPSFRVLQVERAARSLHSARTCPPRAEAREAAQPPAAAATLAAHAIRQSVAGGEPPFINELKG